MTRSPGPYSMGMRAPGARPGAEVTSRDAGRLRAARDARRGPRPATTATRRAGDARARSRAMATKRASSRAHDQQHRHLQARQRVVQRRLCAGAERAQARRQPVGVVAEARAARAPRGRRARAGAASRRAAAPSTRRRRPRRRRASMRVGERLVVARARRALGGILDAGARADQHERGDALRMAHRAARARSRRPSSSRASARGRARRIRASR